MLKSQDFLLERGLESNLSGFMFLFVVVVFKIRRWKQEDLEFEASQGYMRLYKKQQGEVEVGGVFKHISSYKG